MHGSPSEIHYLTLTALFTALLWVPIILNRLAEMGPWTALKNPQPDVRPESDWAYRLACAHRNAIENLVVFAPLALAVHALGVASPATAAAAAIFFAARVAHAVIYTFGIPLLRTIAFFVGFLCEVVLAAQLLGWL
ncbi:MAG: MAPEG family protein [Altererythrobacter sp.]